MKYVYLVIHDWSCESNGNVDMQSIYVFKNYENAKTKVNEIKEQIINFNLGYDEIEEKEDYYCESVNGEYLYYHELVYIKKKEVLDYE